MTLLELDRVGKSFSSGSTALHDVSLTVDPGDFVAVFGDRRCGKTTLLRVAGGLDRPDTGVVRFEGVDLDTLSRQQRARLLRQKIGCVWQSVPLPFNVPVLEIAMIPFLDSLGPRAARTQALAALRDAAVVDCSTAYAHELSDGDRARVAVALGLVGRPALLLADEPTVYLNQIEREQVLATLSANAREHGTAVLMASADAPSTQRAHRRISMGAGRLVEPELKRGQVLPLRPAPGAHG